MDAGIVAPHERARTIHVINISPIAPEKKIADFFTFCGKIERITLLQKNNEEGKQAYIVFGSEEAAQTALLLTNAHIVDRAVKVILVADMPTLPSPQSVASCQPTATSDTMKVVHGHEIDQKEHSAPDNERTKTSVVASLIAAGYVLGGDVLRKARDYDDEHMISLHVKVGAQLIKDKAKSIDQEYGISDKAAVIGHAATALRDSTVQKLHEIDESLKISDKAASVAQSVSQTFTGIASVAMQNENIAKGLSVIQGVGSTVTGAIKERVEREKSDIERAIQEKQRVSQLERHQQNSGAAVGTEMQSPQGPPTPGAPLAPAEQPPAASASPATQ